MPCRVVGCTVGSTDVDKELGGFGGSGGTGAGGGGNKRGAVPGAQSKETPPAQVRLSVDKLEFRVHKGVKAFDFDKDKNMLVTGGMDRTIRLFNPYIPSLVCRTCQYSVATQQHSFYANGGDNCSQRLTS